MKPSAGWTTYGTGPAALSLFQEIEIDLTAAQIQVHGRISMGAPSGTQRQISSISGFVTPMHPSVQSNKRCNLPKYPNPFGRPCIITAPPGDTPLARA